MSLEGDGHAAHREMLIAFDDDAILMALARAGTAVALARNRDAVDFEVWGGGLDDGATVLGGVAQADDSGHGTYQMIDWRAAFRWSLMPVLHRS